MRIHSRSQAAFTILELIVVFIIAAIVLAAAGYGMTTFLGTTQQVDGKASMTDVLLAQQPVVQNYGVYTPYAADLSLGSFGFAIAENTSASPDAETMSMAVAQSGAIGFAMQVNEETCQAGTAQPRSSTTDGITFFTLNGVCSGQQALLFSDPTAVLVAYTPGASFRTSL